MRMRRLVARPDPKDENRRLLVFAFVLVANLLVIGCLLLIWNVNAVNDENMILAVMLLGAVSGLFVLCGISCLLLCVASSRQTRPGNIGVQTVFPTPEFQYFTSTMLNRFHPKASDNLAASPQRSLQPGGSAFSILSTQPAVSLETQSISTATVSPSAGSPQPQRLVGIRDSGEYVRIV